MSNTESNIGICENCGPVPLVISELYKRPMDSCGSCGDQLLYLSNVVVEPVPISED